MKIKPAQKHCGECRACCIDLKIDTPQLRKAAGASCSHLTAAGCGIYATRYKVCQEFLCGWRLLPELGEEWRPDRSGVILIQQAQDTLPEQYRPAGHGVILVIRDGDAAILRPGFAAYIAGLLARGAAVYMSIHSPHTLINDRIDPKVAAGDHPSLARALLHLHRLLNAARGKRGWLGMLPHLYRLKVEEVRAQVAKKFNNINNLE